jgi:hypothetical protein
MSTPMAFSIAARQALAEWVDDREAWEFVVPP